MFWLSTYSRGLKMVLIMHGAPNK